jgi:ATP-binding cassette subfamily C protein
MGGIGLATLAAIDWVRGRMLVRVSARFDRVLAGPTLLATLAGSDLGRTDRAEAMREFDTLRQAISSGAMIALFDAPWAPIYLTFAFLLHPLLGLVTLVGVLLLIAFAWGNERATHVPIAAANREAATAYARQAHVSDFAEEVRALGMTQALTAKALGERSAVARLQLEASLAGGRYAALIKFFRLLFQSAALAVGAWLAVTGRISLGAIIAASLLLSRTLAPIEQLVGAWRQIVRAREAYAKLTTTLGRGATAAATLLPEPTGRILLDGLGVRSPDGRTVLADLSAAIEPGTMVAVAGLSGAGKSTLLRALAGAIDPAAGAVRLDGVALRDWDGDQLARNIGFLPQEFGLFPGTVKENISRFEGYRGVEPARVDAQVTAAAAAIGAHDMIGRLSHGYDTLIGPGGTGLSAGQMQRIAIARALYGDPRILILDEPNAHLDAGAYAALVETLEQLRRRGHTIVVAAHGADLIRMADKLMLLAGGRLARFEDAPGRAAQAGAMLTPVGRRAA